MSIHRDPQTTNTNTVDGSVHDRRSFEYQISFQPGLEAADWSHDPIDLAQKMSDIYTRAALFAFSMGIQSKREHARDRDQLGLAEICEDCGNIIPSERLEASHYEVTRCLDCQRRYELRQR